MKKARIAFILLVILGSLAFESGRLLAAAPKGVLKGTIHWGVSAEYNDPSLAGTYMALFNQYLFNDALIKPMPDGWYSPCLAESWTISRDSRIFEFKLRRGVKFHNGDEMTAEDVVFTFWRYKARSAKFIHGRTEKVEAVNPYLVRITFKEPFPNFLEFFLPGMSTIGWITPKKYIEKVGDAEYRKKPIGCGPYRFVEFNPDVRIVGEAFENFWRKVPQIRRMEFYIVKEASTHYAMVKRGRVDYATFMPDVFYEQAKKDPSLRLLMPLSPMRMLVYIASQWDPKSPWSDVRVRKAASLAIDRKTLADLYMPGAGPNGTLGLEGDTETAYYPPEPYDPGRAKKLMAEAGYPKGFHGGTFYPYDGPYWPYSEQVANYWKAIGITLDTVLLDRPAWLSKRTGGQMKGAIFVDGAISQATVGGALEFLLNTGYAYGAYPDIQTLWDQYNRTADVRGPDGPDRPHSEADL